VLLLPVIVILFYAPFEFGGVDALGSLSVFAAKWRSNDFLFGFLHGSGPVSEESLSGAKRLALLVVALAGVLVLLTRRPLPSAHSWILGAALLVSPVVHPWYLLWLLPALLFVPHVAFWVWTATVILAYHPLPGFLAAGTWSEERAFVLGEYLPVVLILLPQIGWEWARSRRETRPDPAAPGL
jgi:hypothetical protein